MRLFSLLVCLLISIQTHAVNIANCTSWQLNQGCTEKNAEAKLSCLKSRIRQLETCKAKLEAYDAELAKKIKDKINEKGKIVIDPLKEEKVEHLLKLKQLESILGWHDANMKAAAVLFARYVKDFNLNYKATESEIVPKISELRKNIESKDFENYLDLIDIRFDLKRFEMAEQSMHSRFASKGLRLINEFQEIEAFIKEKLSKYEAYLDKNNMAQAPSFAAEVNYLRSVVGYSKARFGKIKREAEKVYKNIDANIIELEKIKLAKDKKEDFKNPKLYERQTGFHKKMVALYKNALIRENLSTFHNALYLGARFNAVKEFLTLDSVCTSKNLEQPDNEYLGWGCGEFGNLRKRAQAKLDFEFADIIKENLELIQTEQPGFKGVARLEILENLKNKNLDQAIRLYDALLQELSKRTEMSVGVML